MLFKTKGQKAHSQEPRGTAASGSRHEAELLFKTEKEAPEAGKHAESTRQNKKKAKKANNFRARPHAEV